MSSYPRAFEADAVTMAIDGKRSLTEVVPRLSRAPQVLADSGVTGCPRPR